MPLHHLPPRWVGSNDRALNIALMCHYGTPSSLESLAFMGHITVGNQSLRYR